MTHAIAEAETTGEPKRPFFAHMLRILAVPIVLFWIAVRRHRERGRPAARGGR